jgi:hypothetical protein
VRQHFDKWVPTYSQSIYLSISLLIYLSLYLSISISEVTNLSICGRMLQLVSCYNRMSVHFDSRCISCIRLGLVLWVFKAILYICICPHHVLHSRHKLHGISPHYTLVHTGRVSPQEICILVLEIKVHICQPCWTNLLHGHMHLSVWSVFDLFLTWCATPTFQVFALTAEYLKSLSDVYFLTIYLKKKEFAQICKFMFVFTIDVHKVKEIAEKCICPRYTMRPPSWRS